MRGQDRAVARHILARAYLLKEDWSRVVVDLEQLPGSVGDQPSTITRLGSGLALLARAHLGRGDLDQARACADEAVALADRQHDPVNGVEARLALSQVLLRTKEERAAPAIGGLLARALSLVEETEARRYEPFIRAERAGLARLLRDEMTRQRELREAHRLFTEMGATGHAERVARELAAAAE